MTPIRPRIAAIGLVCVIALALALRLVGLQYGLPDVYNPDEVAIMARALSFAKGTLNPHNFLYPTLYFYVLFGWVGAYLGFVWLAGGVSSVGMLQQLYFTDPTGIYTAGRLLGAVLGTFCVLAVYRLGRGLYDRTVGLIAAFFLAVSPLAVRDSHYVKHDIPATLAVILAVIAITRVWPRVPRPGRVRNDVIIAGVACGAAFSTHYYCIFLALPLGWAVVQRWRGAGWRMVLRQLVTAGIVSTVVFFALSPFLVVEPVVAWRDITANRQIVIDRAVQSGAFAPAKRYLDMIWSESMGTGVVVLALVGAAATLAKSWKDAVLLLLFPVTFFALIANTTPASRYLNPVLPFIALFAARALAMVFTAPRVPAGLVWVVAALLGASPLLASLRSDRFFRTADTRQIAERFIEAHVPPEATVLVQPYSVALTPSRAGLAEALTRHLGSTEAASTKFQLQLALDPYPQPSYRIIYLGRGGLDVDKIYVDPAELGEGSGLSPLKRLGVTYVVLKRYDTGDPEMTQLVAELTRHGRLIAAFSPYKPGVTEADRARIAPFLHNTDTRIDDALERPGPPLEIWQLNGPDS
ncbi:MAG TPA: glycosyltransferase family 39 protein [Vicinamibacterales bacterium]|nr:glycosyltransferase family 39 protein [Vicinamibacterales bacterium]